MRIEVRPPHRRGTPAQPKWLSLQPLCPCDRLHSDRHAGAINCTDAAVEVDACTRASFLQKADIWRRMAVFEERRSSQPNAPSHSLPRAARRQRPRCRTPYRFFAFGFFLGCPSGCPASRRAAAEAPAGRCRTDEPVTRRQRRSAPLLQACCDSTRFRLGPAV